MVEQLSHGPATVSALAEPIAIALPSALKHLKVLEDGGLVRSEKSGRVRTYRMRPDALAAVAQWVRQREMQMNKAFDRLVEAMTETPQKDD